MEPEPSLTTLLEAITALTATIGSLQDQLKSQGQELIQLKAICKETANLLGNKDQGGQAQPGPLTGPVTPLPTQGGNPHSRHGFDSKEEEEPRRAPKKEPQGTPKRSLSSITPFDSGSSIKRPKMELPDPYKVTEFRNLIAELDWNKEAYIAQFTQGLHWKVKELLSTKDSIPDKLKAIFAAAIKIDNIRRKNEENRPKKAPAKSPATMATTSTTTTQQVRLLEDPNYVTPEEGTVAARLAFVSSAAKRGMASNNAPMAGKLPSRRWLRLQRKKGWEKSEAKDYCQAPGPKNRFACPRFGV
ncbi:hypothetical protein RHS01_05306 [Rhizoctonia solani]|uniref:Uncharacterized protein n=1 Tax=Rhizoctonia solani TaxID=456999 RepID=A0A8H7IE27_9AGAM|nr:hypothetical protein RHS01_05306 [Rhizoctonia solani]